MAAFFGAAYRLSTELDMEPLAVGAAHTDFMAGNLDYGAVMPT